MAGRNFGLTNIYLKMGMGLMLIGLVLFVAGLPLWWPDLHAAQWRMLPIPLSFWLFAAGVVVYVIGRIAKVVESLRPKA